MLRSVVARLRLRSSLALAPLLVLAACAPPALEMEGRQVSGQNIVGGTTSGPEDDAVVQLLTNGEPGCTGTLIAPNLVLTARHCVSMRGGQEGGEQGAPQDPGGEGFPPEGEGFPPGEFGPEEFPPEGFDEEGFGPPGSEQGMPPGSEQGAPPGAQGGDICALEPDQPATVFGVKLGARAASGAVTPDARGVRLFVADGAPRICGSDVALLQLDRKIPGAKIAKIRLTPVQKGESGFLAVGYGVNGRDDQPPPVRMRRGNLKIEAVGPANATFRKSTGETVPYEVPEKDFTTGESTCNGDSGGPLFDAQRRIVGVTSRGLPVENSCIDLPAFYAGLAGNAEIVQRAASAVGLDLSDAKGAADDDAEALPPGEEADDPSSGRPKRRPPAEDLETADDGDGDRERDTTTRSRREDDEDETAATAPTASSGCSAAGTTTTRADLAPLAGLGLALAVGARRRRRSARR